MYTRRRKKPSICMDLCWSLSKKKKKTISGNNVNISETFCFAGAGESSRARSAGEAQMAVLKPRAWGIWVGKGRAVRPVHTRRARRRSCRMGALWRYSWDPLAKRKPSKILTGSQRTKETCGLGGRSPSFKTGLRFDGA